MEKVTLREWQNNFLNHEYADPTFETQVKAGWYDWFCSERRLWRKTRHIGEILCQIHDNGKIDIDNCCVYFMNKCPGKGSLWDEIRFQSLSGERIMFISLYDLRFPDSKKFEVYGHEPDEEDDYYYLFGTDDKRELIAYLNNPWRR